MRLFFAAIGWAVVCSAFEGCGGQMEMYQSTLLVSSKLKIGMSRGDAVHYLGKPQSTETVGATEFLFYTPIWYVSPMLVTSQTPIAIRDGKVVGIGKAYYDETVRSISMAQK